MIGRLASPLYTPLGDVRPNPALAKLAYVVGARACSFRAIETRMNGVPNIESLR